MEAFVEILYCKGKGIVVARYNDYNDVAGVGLASHHHPSPPLSHRLHLDRGQ